MSLVRAKVSVDRVSREYDARVGGLVLMHQALGGALGVSQAASDGQREDPGVESSLCLGEERLPV